MMLKSRGPRYSGGGWGGVIRGPVDKITRKGGSVDKMPYVLWAFDTNILKLNHLHSKTKDEFQNLGFP